MVRSIFPTAAFLFFAGLAGGASGADYHLGIGDRIEVTAVGVPDFNQTLTIGTDGEVSIALIGLVKAAGLTVKTLEDQVRQLAGQKTFRLIRPGTNEFMVLDAQDLSIRVASYRPVFVSGDVGKPGMQPFSPGLTNRQAISVAGGCDLTRFGVLNPVITSADVRSEYERAWVEFTSESFRLRRLEAEIEGNQKISRTDLGEIPLSQSLLEGFEKSENEKLQVRLAEIAAQKAFYEKQSDVLARRVDVLQKQRTAEEQGLKSDEDEVARITDQARTGVSAVNRVAEARRVSLISATRVLQIGVAAATARREQEQAAREGDAILAKRREDVLTEMQDARGKIEAARVRLQSAGDKLVYTGLFRSQMSRGYGEPELTLFRKGGDEAVARETAAPDADMQPGDVLQVRCPFDPEDLRTP